MNFAECFRPSKLLGLVVLAIFTCAAATFGMTQGRVTGKVTFQDKPVKGALVLAVSSNSGQKTALTDPEGHYAINLSLGTYILTVVHSVYVVDDAGYGCKLTEIRNESSLDVDFVLTRGGVISGAVSDIRGQPLVGQQVLYEIVDKPFAKPCLMAGQDNVRTDDQGTFRIFGLPTGKYRIGIGREERRDIGKSAGPFRTTYYPGVDEKVRAEMVDVSPGQETRLPKFVVITPAQGFSAEVSAVDEDTGNALPGIDFDVISVVNDAAANKTPLKTGAAGSIKVLNLDPGHYRILSPVRNGGSPIRNCSPVSFEIAHEDLNDIVIRCGEVGLSIQGRVTINGNSAATDLDCAIALKEGEDLLGRVNPTYGVRLGPQGSFVISGLRKTVYTLVILPLRPSLQYEYAQLDGRVFHSPQLFGQLILDMRTGIKMIAINLAQK